MEAINIARCESYEYSKVAQAVFKCLDGIEEIKLRIYPGAKVLVKTNLLMRKNPEDAVTTHPAVIEGIVRYLQEKGCKVIVGDSPAGPFTERLLKGIYKTSGMQQVAENTGCELNYDTSVVDVVNPKAKMLKTMQIIKVVENADFVVSAAKLKTHGMMTYSGAVKNLFGVIPGLTKAEYHFKMNDEMNFAEHLVDICEYVKPIFSVIDAIEGMEGNGPSAGEKRSVGLVMASSNPYALDVAAAHLIGISPAMVPTIRVARERGIFNTEPANLEVEGIPLKDIQIPKFKLPDSVKNINFIGGRVPKSLEKTLVNTLRAKPVFNHDLCIGCKDCIRSCPPKIISMNSGGKPIPELDKCIGCFCCHEVCPKKAIEIKKHWLHKVLFK